MNVSWQTQGTLYRKGSVANIYGEEQLSLVGRIKLGVVRFIDSIDKSSVRADSSASRGKADQEEFDAVFITPVESGVRKDDILLVDGVKVRVILVHRRYGLRGRPGHLEIGATIWA